MISELRRSRRFNDFIAVKVEALNGMNGEKEAGPFSGRIINISRHGACLLMTQVLLKTYHVFHTTKEDEEAVLELHINIPPAIRDFVLPCRPVWMSPFQLEEIKAYKMGVDFLIDPDGEKMMRLEKEIMQKQKERDEVWSSLAAPFLKK